MQIHNSTGLDIVDRHCILKDLLHMSEEHILCLCENVYAELIVAVRIKSDMHTETEIPKEINE